MKHLILSFLALFLTVEISAQELESELGFLYVKAEYLLDTDRYEEAIQEFNKIIEQDPAYKDALYKRASAKFAIAAFQGSKLDLLRSFEFTGVTPEAILLYGKTLKNLDEHDAASKTLKTASMIYEEKSSEKKPRKRPSERMNERKTEDPSTEDTSGNDESTGTENDGGNEQGGLNELEEKVSDILDDILGKNNDEEPVEEEEVYRPDMSINEIYVDEDLTIIIKDGLGGRKILEQPNILILSETSGTVAVNVCVNSNGKVTSAEYDKQKSSLEIQSLVSLAVRKSKEFWFEAMSQDEICGTILFQITGRT